MEVIDNATYAWAVYARSLLEELVLVCPDPIHVRQLTEMERIIKGHEKEGS